MTPRQRERAILALITEQPVETQQDLVVGLEERGVEVTQATISRDIKRLGLFKRPLPDGRYRYAAPEVPKTSPGEVGGFVIAVEPVLEASTAPSLYKPGTWGPKEAMAGFEPAGGWVDPQT